MATTKIKLIAPLVPFQPQMGLVCPNETQPSPEPGCCPSAYLQPAGALLRTENKHVGNLRGECDKRFSGGGFVRDISQSMFCSCSGHEIHPCGVHPCGDGVSYLGDQLLVVGVAEHLLRNLSQHRPKGPLLASDAEDVELEGGDQTHQRTHLRGGARGGNNNNSL